MKERPSLSLLALISFVASFLIARTFTTITPDTTLFVSGGLHIHHFWYGLIMLAIGGWLGISYDEVKIDRIAAILFGAGGGLVVDEVGLLLTLESKNYWAGITYTFIIIFLTLMSILFLLNRYSATIRREFVEFLSRRASLYFGVFLVAVSIAFIMETDDVLINAASSISAIAACIIILSYVIGRFRNRRREPL
jgi:hypothetical protein